MSEAFVQRAQIADIRLTRLIKSPDRPFMPDSKASLNEHTFNSLHKCISAAKGCIRIGSLVKTVSDLRMPLAFALLTDNSPHPQLLPSSHHCQFCVQYLTISGIILLRCIVYLQGNYPSYSIRYSLADVVESARRCRSNRSIPQRRCSLPSTLERSRRYLGRKQTMWRAFGRPARCLPNPDGD